MLRTRDGFQTRNTGIVGKALRSHKTVNARDPMIDRWVMSKGCDISKQDTLKGGSSGARVEDSRRYASVESRITREVLDKFESGFASL